ncbi:MAG: hypothetical protein H7Y42_18765 [Chitinophagaceae bacterium]|nr:hypothetical protein [Chitinophagaceae bacterium]
MTKRLLILHITLIIFARTVFCQYYYHDNRYMASNIVLEAGVTMGAMNSLTDIGGKPGIGKGFIKDLRMEFSRPCIGIYLGATYKDVISLRVEATLGSTRASDDVLKNDREASFGRYERNLSFRSPIREVQLCAEVHPLFFRNYETDEAPYWSPYLVAGIGLFSFNPQARLRNKWLDLHPLRTEGQGFPEYRNRKPYSLLQLNVPAGLGLRYEAGPFVTVRAELIHRFLFTDYLDDVSEDSYVDPALFHLHLPAPQAEIAAQLSNRSGRPFQETQRGNPSRNDSYFTFVIKIGMQLRRLRRD